MSDEQLLKDAETALKNLCDFLAKGVAINAAINGQPFVKELKSTHCREAAVLVPAVEVLTKIHARLNP